MSSSMILLLSMVIISTSLHPCGTHLAESVGLTSTTRKGVRAANTPGDAIRRHYEISDVTRSSLSEAQEIPTSFTSMIKWVPQPNSTTDHYSFDLLLSDDAETAVLIAHHTYRVKGFLNSKRKHESYLLRLSSTPISDAASNKLFSGGRRYTSHDSSPFARSLKLEVSENTNYANLTFENDTGNFALALRAGAKVEDQFKVPFVFAIADSEPKKVAHSGVMHFLTSQRALRHFFVAQAGYTPSTVGPSLDLKIIELPRFVEDRRIRVHRGRMRWRSDLNSFVIALDAGGILKVDLSNQNLHFIPH